MKLLRTSTTALIAAGLLAGAMGAASACDWQKQVMAKATTPPADEQTATSATPVDPTVLARTETTDAKTITVQE